jgi:hypothetical protein
MKVVSWNHDQAYDSKNWRAEISRTFTAFGEGF